tara:strand:- start:2367 stop:3398 length:1032 start_codon:yes stop_codon:yes gene_type:complete
MGNLRNIFVSGAAGFIGFHVCSRLIDEGFNVIGLDNINSYYETKLKTNRLFELEKKGNKNNNWIFFKGDLQDNDLLNEIFENHNPNIIIHLGAQAGVRYSIENPKSYINSNLIGFANILECCRNKEIKNFIYASSSSVYGGNTKIPFSENDQVNHQVSLYAATKKSNEILAHSYSHLYNIPSTGLRFFTVYGPWGRPDMAPMIFTKSIFSKQKIKIFNNGDMFRDFTYIDDVVEIIFRLTKRPATKNQYFDKNNPDPATSWAPFRIFNIGNNNPISLMQFIKALEKEIGIEAEKEFLEMQLGDVKSTHSKNELIREWTNYEPITELEDGIKRFISWYRSYYKK